MAQEPENAFMTTTSCLPAHIQPSKWHLIAQCVAMVTFISHIEVYTQTHTELEGSQAPSFNDTRNIEPKNFPNLWKLSCPQGRSWGVRSRQPLAGRDALLVGCTTKCEPSWGFRELTWEQFCSGRSLPRYGLGLSENWHSCSAPWRCGVESSLLSCEEEQKQDGVSTSMATFPVVMHCGNSKHNVLNWKTLKSLIFSGKARSTFCNTAVTGSLISSPA